MKTEKISENPAAPFLKKRKADNALKKSNKRGKIIINVPEKSNKVGEKLESERQIIFQRGKWFRDSHYGAVFLI